MTTAEKWIDYFEYRRRDEIWRYLWTGRDDTRRDARRWALHYGRLRRKMEREQ